MCIKIEYVPDCFRKGVQVPLYKGKGTCSLNPDNYRGITLLSNFNKLFEVLIWSRLERWWVDNRVISDLQGACRKGSSCIHTALTLHYDHVGIKSCVMGDTHVRTLEKIEKSKKALNMSTNMGIIKGGLNLRTCCTIYWSVVFPTLTFGCEAWVIKAKDVELLQSFQRYAARRLQRLHFRSINSTCTACLGWMEIIRVIKAKKLIFIRSIAYMTEYSPIRSIFVGRINEFERTQTNPYASPIIQLLEFSVEFQVLDAVKNMFNGIPISKLGWKRLI